MVSIKDIANACGVSAATVSKALHDQKDVGKATKEKIKRIKKEKVNKVLHSKLF